MCGQVACAIGAGPLPRHAVASRMGNPGGQGGRGGNAGGGGGAQAGEKGRNNRSFFQWCHKCEFTHWDRQLRLAGWQCTCGQGLSASWSVLQSIQRFGHLANVPPSTGASSPGRSKGKGNNGKGKGSSWNAELQALVAACPDAPNG